MADSGADLLETITTALSEATPGPWRLNPEREKVAHIPDGLGGWGEPHAFRSAHDAYLFAHAPEWLAALVTEVRRLRGAISTALPVFEELLTRWPDDRNKDCHLMLTRTAQEVRGQLRDALRNQ